MVVCIVRAGYPYISLLFNAHWMPYKVRNPFELGLLLL